MIVEGGRYSPVNIIESERLNSLVGALIEKRIKQHSVLDEEHQIKLPMVSFPHSVNEFFNSRQLWVPVDAVNFTSSAVVAQMLRRTDGNEKTRGSFSVFIAMQKDYIAKTWHQYPLSAWNKQKNQFWDELFVKALFTNIILHEHAKNHNVNKIAYSITPVADIEELRQTLVDSSLKAIKFSL